MSWFKTLNGILASFILLFLLFLGYFMYGIRELSNPNFIEFGPMVALYRIKDCADNNVRAREKLEFQQCFLANRGESMYKNSTKTLDKVIESAANQKEGLFSFKRLPVLNGYPKSGSEWSCYNDGRLILNPSNEIIHPGYYTCWPK